MAVGLLAGLLGLGGGAAKAPAVGQDPKTTTLLRWTKGVWFESGAQFPTLNDLYIYIINDLNGITGFTHDYPWTLHPCQGNSWCLCCLSSLAKGMVNMRVTCTAKPDSAKMGTAIVHPETVWEWQKLAESTWTLLELIWLRNFGSFWHTQNLPEVGFVPKWRMAQFYSNFHGGHRVPKMQLIESWGSAYKRESQRPPLVFWFSSTPLPMLLDFSAVPKVPKRSNRFPKNLSEQTGTIRHELAFWTLDLISTYF